MFILLFFFFFQAEDGIRDYKVTGVQTCALPISSSSSLSERMSTFKRASWGTEFTEVPPSIWPMLKVVRGLAGTLVLIKRTAPRTSALMGLGMPKSDQLWPPGPVIRASSRREARAFVVT